MLYHPFFTTDTGFIRTRVQQMAAGDKNRYNASSAHPNASSENLTGIDLTNLFSLLNVVVVTDQGEQEDNTVQLTISKTVKGTNLNEADYTGLYEFKVTLKDANGTELGDTFKCNFYGKDKWGYVSSGDTLFLHHDESVTILGLPAETEFTVTEMNPRDGWYVTPSQEISGIAGEADAEFVNTTDPSPSPSPVPFVKWWDPEIEEWVYIPEDELPLADMYPYPNPEPVYDPVPYFTLYPEPDPEPNPEPSPSPASGVPATGDWNVLWLIAFGMSLAGLVVIRSLPRKEDENG